MCRKEMIDYILEQLPNADNDTLEQIYWYLLEIEY